MRQHAVPVFIMACQPSEVDRFHDGLIARAFRSEHQ
jgi:hypothetical protein